MLFKHDYQNTKTLPQTENLMTVQKNWASALAGQPGEYLSWQVDRICKLSVGLEIGQFKRRALFS